MRAVFAAWFVALTAASGVAAAQTGRAPTRPSTKPTAAETAGIETGIKLHDQGKYDDAIAKYQEVLTMSPANMTALYELAFSFAANKEFEKSLAAATRGIEYQSDLLPMFYDLIASAHDSMGEADKAIDAYRKGLQVVPDAAVLYFNMGVTYLESVKNADEARRAMEKAVALDPRQPEFHLMLGHVFQTSGYPAPAFLAFSTYLIEEPGGSRALSAYGFWRAILRGESSRTTRGGSAAGDAQGAKTDEGDFRPFEMAIANSEQTVIAEMDKGAEELPTLLAHVHRLMNTLVELPPADDRAAFAAAYYLPFFRELKAKNYVEPWAYWSMQRAPVQGVREWLAAHPDQVREFVNWARAYQWTRP